MVNSSQHTPGQKAHLLFQALSENDTHCLQFSYFMFSRDGHSPGTLSAYVWVTGGLVGSAVWNASGSHGRQWHQAELAVSLFWPSEYQVRPCSPLGPIPAPPAVADPCLVPQVLFEAVVSSERRGYLGLDDILLLNYPCCECHGMGPEAGLLLGWPGQQGLELVSIGMVLGRVEGLMPGGSLWHLGVLMLPGLVDLHLLGASKAPFCISILIPTSCNVAFSFYKTLEKHRLNTRPECPHQEWPPRLVAVQNPRLSQHIGSWGHILFLPGWSGDLPPLSSHALHLAPALRGAGEKGSSLPGLVLWGQEHMAHWRQALRVGIRPVQSLAQL